MQELALSLPRTCYNIIQFVLKTVFVITLKLKLMLSNFLFKQKTT